MPASPRSGALMESVSRKGRTRRGIIVAVAVGLILVTGLAIGLGVGLGKRKDKDDSTAVSTMDAASTDAAIRDRTVGGSVTTTPSTGGTTTTTPGNTTGNTTGTTNGTNAPTTPTIGSTPAVNSTGTTTAVNSTGTTTAVNSTVTTTAVNSTDAIPAVNTTLPVVPTNPPPSPPPPVPPPPPTPPPPATPPLPAEEAGNENCDKFIPNADVAGTDMPGSGVGTASNKACLDLCKTTPNCNTVVRLGSGQCFMKSLDEDAAPFARNGVTSYIICSALNPPPVVLPPSAAEKELQQYFSTGAQCPPDGIAYPQWTGRAESIIGVPTPIQKLYEDLNDGFYNAATKKYTLQFTPLPADLTYCTEGATTVENACKAPKGATNTLQQCGATENIEQWTFNSGTGKCEPFAYNGCGGNANQFKSQSLCQAACETPIKATMGGTITFSKGDGKCSLPPTKPDGSPCCAMKFWQPNYAGYYYDNCSVQRDVGSDGLFYFKTEIPGSELSAEWGPDPEPHIHYDMVCTGCAQNEFFTGEYRYWNKFYPEDPCDLKSCWGNNKIHLAPGPEHQAQKSEVVKGELRYTYHMTLPAQDDPNGINKLIG